jgi:predicted outer membrane protein
MAPASDDSTGRGFPPFPLPSSTQEGTTIMTDQPARVTPGEISELLDHARQMISGVASLDEQIAYHQRKANLLSQVAADLDTPEAHQVAADAWHYLGSLCRRADAQAGTKAAQ